MCDDEDTIVANKMSLGKFKGFDNDLSFVRYLGQLKTLKLNIEFATPYLPRYVRVVIYVTLLFLCWRIASKNLRAFL